MEWLLRPQTCYLHVPTDLDRCFAVLLSTEATGSEELEIHRSWIAKTVLGPHRCNPETLALRTTMLVQCMTTRVSPTSSAVVWHVWVGSWGYWTTRSALAFNRTHGHLRNAACPNVILCMLTMTVGSVAVAAPTMPLSEPRQGSICGSSLCLLVTACQTERRLCSG